MLYHEGHWHISVAESGVMRKAARMLPDIDLVKVHSHYQAVRTRNFADKRVFRFELNQRTQEFQDEVYKLPRLRQWEGTSFSALDTEYIFGEKLTMASVNAVQAALEATLFVPDAADNLRSAESIKVAQLLVKNFQNSQN